MLDARLIEEFTTDGFVVTPELLTADELARYGGAVDAAVQRRLDAVGASVPDETEYQRSFVQCMRLWETDAAVAPLTFHPRLARAAAELLQVESVLLWQDQALYKPPGARVTDPHQDAPLWPVGAAPMVSAWIPFDDVTSDTGAMSYVRGSHRVDGLAAVDLVNGPHDVLAHPVLGGAEPEEVEVAAGSVVWHHGMTIHRAQANRSESVRRVFTIVYLAPGHRRTTPAAGFPRDRPNFPLDRAGVAVGDLMEGEGLPVAWPRPSGSLPEPPDVIGVPVGPQIRLDA